MDPCRQVKCSKPQDFAVKSPTCTQITCIGTLIIGASKPMYAPLDPIPSFFVRHIRSIKLNIYIMDHNGAQRIQKPRSFWKDARTNMDYTHLSITILTSLYFLRPNGEFQLRLWKRKLLLENQIQRPTSNDLLAPLVHVGTIHLSSSIYLQHAVFSLGRSLGYWILCFLVFLLGVCQDHAQIAQCATVAGAATSIWIAFCACCSNMAPFAQFSRAESIVGRAK